MNNIRIEVNENFSIAYVKQQYIIFSLTSERLENYIVEIEFRLSRLGAKGRILLDLICSNGISVNRYISMLFDGEQFILVSIAKEMPNNEIIEASYQFYEDNHGAIENSVLTKPQKFLFRKRKVKNLTTQNETVVEEYYTKTLTSEQNKAITTLMSMNGIESLENCPISLGDKFEVSVHLNGKPVSFGKLLELLSKSYQDILDERQRLDNELAKKISIINDQQKRLDKIALISNPGKGHGYN